MSGSSQPTVVSVLMVIDRTASSQLQASGSISRPRWADRLRDLPNQLIAELPRPAVTIQPGRHRRIHIPAGGLAIHPRLLSHLAQPCTSQPRPQHLTDLSHGNLPECHPEPPSPSTWKIAYRK